MATWLALGLRVNFCIFFAERQMKKAVCKFSLYCSACILFCVVDLVSVREAEQCGMKQLHIRFKYTSQMTSFNLEPYLSI